jgi:prepilin peptidase CpaA
MDLDHVILIVFVVLFTATSAVVDWRFKKLPNIITVPMFFAGIVFHMVAGAVAYGWSGMGGGLLFSLGGFAIGFGVLFVVWMIGGGGGGDVKYMGALGAWLGPMLTLVVFLLTMVIMVVASAVVLINQAMKSGIGRTKKKYLAIEQGKIRGDRRTKQEKAVQRRLLPYAVPVALSTWIALATALLVKLPTFSELFSKS